MTDIFRDQPYLVTGAGSGIGLETARLLAERGARLAIWDRNADTAETTAETLNAVTFRACDVALGDAVQRHMAATVERLGGLRGVIHSAGILRVGLFGTLPLEQHRAQVEVNLIGTINIAHAALPHLLASGGSLVMMGSASAFYGSPEYNTYGATKAALLNLAQALNIEYADRGVHIGIANPLFVDTPMVAVPEGRGRLIESKTPFNTLHKPGEVAAALLRGIERREGLIWVGNKPRWVYWLSRYGAFLGGRMMARTWKQASG